MTGALAGCSTEAAILPWLPLGIPIPPEALTATAAAAAALVEVVMVILELMFWCCWPITTLAVVIRLPPPLAAATPPPAPPVLPTPLLITLGGKLPPAPLLALEAILSLAGTLAELNVFTLLTLLVRGFIMLTVVPVAELCNPGADPGATTPTD